MRADKSRLVRRGRRPLGGGLAQLESPDRYIIYACPFRVENRRTHVHLHDLLVGVVTVEVRPYRRVLIVYGGIPGVHGEIAVRYLFPDSEGLLWVATERTGIWSYNPEKSVFRHYEHPRNVMSYYVDSLAMVKEHGGQLWIKMNNYGFGYYDRENDTIVPLDNVKDGEKCRFMNGVACFEVDSTGVVWFSTVMRGLETYVTTNDEVNAYDGWTNKFIFPPYRFAVPDAIVSNFHLPCSTMLMSVAAFGGYENVMKAYDTALKEDYRFGPYGDALLII